jgi:hypothetical protein
LLLLLLLLLLMLMLMLMLMLHVPRYQKLLAECSPVRLLDLKDMQKQVGASAVECSISKACSFGCSRVTATHSTRAGAAVLHGTRQCQASQPIF